MVFQCFSRQFFVLSILTSFINWDCLSAVNTGTVNHTQPSLVLILFRF